MQQNPLVRLRDLIPILRFSLACGRFIMDAVCLTDGCGFDARSIRRHFTRIPGDKTAAGNAVKGQMRAGDHTAVNVPGRYDGSRFHIPMA